MANLKPPVQLNNPQNAPIVNYILEEASRVDFDFPQVILSCFVSKAPMQVFFSNCRQLWTDTGVQEAFERSNEYQLIDCAK